MQMWKDMGRREIYITVEFVQLRKDLPSEAVLGSHSLPVIKPRAQYNSQPVRIIKEAPGHEVIFQFMSLHNYFARN